MLIPNKRTMKRILLLFLTFLVINPSLCFPAIKNNIQILLSSKSSIKEQLAAKELRRYIYLRSGSLAKVLPTNSLTDLPGEYIIVCTKNSALLKLSGDAKLIADAAK